jgi:hypothetical protein
MSLSDCPNFGNTSAANGRLTPAHLADLRGSGLTDETIAAAGLYSEHDPAAVGRLLGWPGPANCLGPCLCFPFRDAAGHINKYTRVKPSRPRLDDKRKPIKYESPRRKGNRAYFPLGTIAALADPAAPLLITEGEKKSLCADQHGFPCIGVTGIWSWTKKRPKGGGPFRLIDDLDTIGWGGRRVYLVFDSDAATNFDVLLAEFYLAKTIQSRGADVLVVRLRSGANGEKVGLDDFLIAHGPDALRELLDEAKPAEKPKAKCVPDGRSLIFVRPEEHEVIDEVVGALAAADVDIYQRGGQLVRTICEPRPDDAGGPAAPRISTIPLANLRTRITRYVQLAQQTGEGDVPTHPPGWLAEGAAAAGVWPLGIRPLVGLSETPVLRPDGSILQTPGYDATTGILYVPLRDYPKVPDRLTQADAKAAAAALREVVCDFPFEKPEHEAAWLAGVLTPFARFAYRGPAPLFLADANVPGCGKSLLTDVAGLIMAEAGFAHQAYPAGRDPAEEMRKNITSLAVRGERHVLLDNLPGHIGNSSLDMALTTTEWVDRVLGHTQIVRVPLLMTWWASGNNVSVQGDTARRVLPVRLLSPEEHPEERSGFVHPDLHDWVKRERGRLAAAALTLLAAYIRAGRPDQKVTAWGSFEGWSNLVRSAIVWAGLPDPRGACVAFASQADTAVAALAAMLEAWPEVDPTGSGQTVAKALKLLKDQPGNYESLREALGEFCPTRGKDLPEARALGDRLRHVRLRNVGGKRFNSRPAGRGVVAWFVEEAKPVAPESGSGGSGGSVSPGPPKPKNDAATNTGESQTQNRDPKETDPPEPPDPLGSDPAPPRTGSFWGKPGGSGPYGDRF